VRVLVIVRYLKNGSKKNCATQLEPGKVLILDNATFHQGEKIRELVESAGCKLQYLPPYSPDLNKIEHCWFPIKNRVRKSQGSIEDFRDRVDGSS